MTEINDEPVPDESEQLDQLDSEQSLIDRGVDDPLDEGYTTPENWSAGERFGNTPAEAREGETLEMRIAQEEPEQDSLEDPDDWRHGELGREVGNRRAGRLVDDRHGYPGEDRESDVLGEDVGIDGGAASAEEAAMHIIDDDEDDLLDEDAGASGGR